MDAVQSTRSSSAVRGTEVLLNGFWMGVNTLRVWIFLSLLVSGITGGYLLNKWIPYADKVQVTCALKQQLLPTELYPEIRCVGLKGKYWKRYSRKKVMRIIQPSLNRTAEVAKKAGYISLGLFLLTFFFLWFLSRRKGKHLVKDSFIRGAQKVTSEQLTSLLESKNEASIFRLGGVPLLKGSEVEHCVITGATGAGKSVAMKELLDEVRKQKQRAIILDVSGEFVSTYFNPKTDTILNPLDSRSPSWSLWDEVVSEFDYETIAASLIPQAPGQEPFWTSSARALFVSIAKRLKEEGSPTHKKLFHWAAIAPLGELYVFLEGTPAGALVDPASEKTAASIRSTLTNAIRIFSHLHEEEQGEGFSIRSFIENEEGEGCLFLTTRSDQIEFLKPILSCWISIAATTTLSLEESRERRIWFFLDELGSLQKLPLLALLERGRKNGAACVLGFQALSQLKSIYGPMESSTILQNCKTGLFLQAVDSETAKAVSQACGNQEVLETGESQSFGPSTYRDGVNLSRRRVTRPIVMDSEFLRMPRLTGYVRLPYDYPIAKIQLTPKDREKVAPGFNLKDGPTI